MVLSSSSSSSWNDFLPLIKSGLRFNVSCGTTTTTTTDIQQPPSSSSSLSKSENIAPRTTFTL
ncbi:hypothetical protein DERP_010396 [Dermatophagoides pteronyssinus]|uniref:Uncharacterized protein n=1 Tax=Dermatophagoides pteronyssinus TaxID=6956 RepID=A0ABQ8J514_DERPT|nr:hypothetical protein DERP_010396 [Dermatophagoides pteronyssinus]